VWGLELVQAAGLSECGVCCGAWVVVPFQAGAAAGCRCEMSMAVWVLGPDGDYIYTVSKKERVWLLPKNIFCYLGSMPA